MKKIFIAILLIIFFIGIFYFLFDFLIKKANNYIGKSEFVKAEKIINKLSVLPNNKKLLIAKCLLYGAKNHASFSENSEEDILKIQKILAIIDKKYLGKLNLYDYKSLSFCSDVAKDYNRTIKYLELALKKWPDNAELNSFMGLAYDSIYNFQEAKKYYTKAYMLDKNNLTASWYYVGRVLYQDIYKEDTRKLIHSILNYMLNSEDILYNQEMKEKIYDTRNRICLLDAQNQKNQNSYVKDFCIKDLELFSKNNIIRYSWIYNDLAFSYISLNLELNELLYTTKKDNFDKKYFELAKSYLDQANKIDPSDFMPYLLNGIIFEYDNDYSSALEYFWRAYKSTKTFSLLRGFDRDFYQIAILLNILKIINQPTDIKMVENLINDNDKGTLEYIQSKLDILKVRHMSPDLFKLIQAINR